MKRLIKELRSIFEKNDIHSKLENHNHKMLEANFWQDKLNCQKIIKEKKLFEDLINSYNSSETNINDIRELLNLATEENNQNILNGYYF